MKTKTTNFSPGTALVSYNSFYQYHLLHRPLDNKLALVPYNPLQTSLATYNKFTPALLNREIYKRKYSMSKDYPQKLSAYLVEINKIMNQHKDNPHLAQELIERKWLDIAKDSFTIKSELYKKEKWIFDNALGFLKDYFKKGHLTRKFTKDFSEFLIDNRHIMLAFSIIIMYYSRVGHTNIAYKIGRSIMYTIYKEKFTEFKSFADFENDKDIDNPFYIKLGSFFIDIFSSPFMIEIFEKRFHSERMELIINKKFEEDIRRNLIIHPQTLPMVVKPNIWSKNSYGGFLENNKENENAKGLITGSEQHKHKILISANVYKAINYLNGLEFRINNDLLEYFENEGSFIIEELKNKDKKSYFSLLITLDIARTFRNIPFYLNVNMDWRGRIYTQSFYLDYQGNELSVSLINLCKGEKLTEKGKFFFFIYGANCYNDNNMQKKKFEERYNWVIQNIDKIYLMDRDFILKAESPTLFASFCLSMRKMKDNPDYIHYSPIFLDATCSGIQHFAAMLLDFNLAEEVNLIENEEVKDVYQKLVDPINKAINEAWLEDSTLAKLQYISLTRKELKSVIMTKSYNVTTFGIIEQLKSKLELIERKDISKNGKEYNKKFYKVPAINTEGFIELNEQEIEKVGRIINDNIFNHFPSLYSIYKFFTDIAKIMIKLSIPITWATPAGLEIIQHYVSSNVKKITINFLGKNKTAVLREWNSGSIDTRKQVQAIIPNIIHSLDASHLINVINTVKNGSYILPIHDCFGTHPNHMDELASIVRKEFIKLYSDKSFLEKIYNKFVDDIIDYGYNIIEKDGQKYIEFIKKRGKIENILLPPIPKMGKLNLDTIEKSNYMIC